MSSRRTGIPIPSFGAASPVQEEETKYLMLPIHSRNLLQVDCALQVYFNQSKTTSISYSEFRRTLAPKLVLEGPSFTSTSGKSELPLPSTLQELSRDDRLWHDLTCVFVPQLYHLVKDGTVLERQKTIDNRMTLAKKLLEQAETEGIDEKRSNEALKMLYVLLEQIRLTDETKKKNAAKENVKTSEEKASSNVIITPGMTLEERVRARAAQRDQALLKVHHNKEKDEATDLVKITDALFSHARLVLRRSSRKQLIRKNNHRKGEEEESTTAIFVFQDLLASMPDTSRKELSAILKSITHECPGWIRWKNPSTYKKQDVISKKATVWLETGDYKRVRAKLNGEAPPPQHTPTNRSTSDTVPAVTVSGNKRTDAPWRFSKLQQVSKRRSTVATTKK
jgi:hypothetical protein